ncbi:hypothetical protein [Burkholderia ubonensis]|uniref:hypothetical protein n=1 Tax=Burkholderia ubonensis TaxID=101571 RepID=UPI00075CDEB6|nr:hypothetical protein [Burkholderia ubonensis]KVL65427.1 hypothetical protein WJ48_01535 [Burkholderia ubonensis]KVL76339.1 hypothetical protein WJ49_11595 [Burkholderia ubonensis]KVL92084.1 hypothetical protein WJ50_10740 [Burkholderia ubonensis]
MRGAGPPPGGARSAGCWFGLAAAGAWVGSTRAPRDPLGGDPHATLSPDPPQQQGPLNLADWTQAAEAGRRTRIAAALTALAVVLSSATSLLSLAPHG